MQSSKALQKRKYKFRNSRLQIYSLECEKDRKEMLQIRFCRRRVSYAHWMAVSYRVTRLCAPPFSWNKNLFYKYDNLTAADERALPFLAQTYFRNKFHKFKLNQLVCRVRIVAHSFALF